jgi:hypothetical protein
MKNRGTPLSNTAVEAIMIKNIPIQQAYMTKTKTGRKAWSA